MRGIDEKGYLCGMKTTLCYELEMKVRKERKRIAVKNCRLWEIQYDCLSGRRYSVPCLSRELIKSTRLPATNDGRKTVVVAMG